MNNLKYSDIASYDRNLRTYNKQVLDVLRRRAATCTLAYEVYLQRRQASGLHFSPGMDYVAFCEYFEKNTLAQRLYQPAANVVERYLRAFDRYEKHLKLI